MSTYASSSGQVMLFRLFRTSLVSLARPSEGTDGFLRSIAMSRLPLDGAPQTDITSGARFRQACAPAAGSLNYELCSKPSRTTEFQIVEKGIPHWNQRTEVSRFRRRSEPSDVSLQKSKGNSVRATGRSSVRIFPQPLSICFLFKDFLDKAECRQFKTFRV